MGQSFFDEYMYDKDQKKIFEKIMKDTVDIINEKIDDTKDNLLLYKKTVYKKIRYQKVDISSSRYSIDSFVDTSDVIILMDSSSLTHNERVQKWNDYTIEEKVSILDKTGFYTFLSDNVIVIPAPISKTFKIIDFNVLDMKNIPLLRNIDYYYIDNKLYLLRELNSNLASYNNFVILTDIVYDDNSSENGLGVTLQIPYANTFTKIEYFEMMKNFTKCMALGPTLSNIASQFSELETLKNISVFDKYNAPPSMQGFWNYKGGVGSLNDFDFLVSMPLEYINDDDKMGTILDFFKLAKPAYTNYIMSPTLILRDKINKDNIHMTVEITCETIPGEGGKDGSSFKDIIDIYETKDGTEIEMEVSDTVYVVSYEEYIRERRYDDKYKYDGMTFFDGEKGSIAYLFDRAIVGILKESTLFDFITMHEGVSGETELNKDDFHDKINSSEKYEFISNSGFSDKMNAASRTNPSRLDNLSYCDTMDCYFDSAEEDVEGCMNDYVTICL